MSQTKTKKEPKQWLVRAVQPMFHNNVMRLEQEVFVYTGDALPGEDHVVVVPEGTPLGLPAPLTPEQQREAAKAPPPKFTTSGYVQEARTKGTT